MMPLILILVIGLAFIPDHALEGVPDPFGRAGLTGLGVLLVAAFAELTSRYFCRLLHRHPESRQPILYWYGWGRTVHVLLILGVYLVTLFVIRWGAVVRVNAGLKNAVLLDEILVLAPFLLSLVAGWFSFYRLERMIHETSLMPFQTLGAYIWFRVRHYLGLILFPILIFTGIHEAVLWLLPGLHQQQWFQLGWVAALLIMVLVLMPWFLTVIWGAKSLPAGPLRDRLVAMARRLGFRYTDILLWDTQGGMANAMVTGIVPVPRYVMLSDTLVRDLSPEQVEAVFGHEIGHVKHQHILLYFSFLVLSVFLLAGILPPLEMNEVDWSMILGTAFTGDYVWSTHLPALGILGGYIWLVFGFLSRRCERQADVYGCKAVSCDADTCHGNGFISPAEMAMPDGIVAELIDAAAAMQRPHLPTGRGTRLCPTGIRTFIQALERVADLNGIHPNKPSWRHSSIARRVEFLERLLVEPAAERRFQIRLALTKGGLLLSLTGLIVLMFF